MRGIKAKRPKTSRHTMRPTCTQFLKLLPVCSHNECNVELIRFLFDILRVWENLDCLEMVDGSNYNFGGGEWLMMLILLRLCLYCWCSSHFNKLFYGWHIFYEIINFKCYVSIFSSISVNRKNEKITTIFYV